MVHERWSRGVLLIRLLPYAWRAISVLGVPRVMRIFDEFFTRPCLKLDRVVFWLLVIGLDIQLGSDIARTRLAAQIAP